MEYPFLSFCLRDWRASPCTFGPRNLRASPERYPFTVLPAGRAAKGASAEPESFTPSVGQTFSCKVHLAYSICPAKALAPAITE